MGLSSGSRKGDDISATSSLSSETKMSVETSSSACSCVRWNLMTSFSRTSAQTNGVTTGVQNAADDSSTQRQTQSRASAASQTLESRRTNTPQPQNFVFAHLRSILHQGVGASPQIFEALLLQPAQNFFSLSCREFFQFPDDISCAHDENNTYEATRRKIGLLIRRRIMYHKPLLTRRSPASAGRRRLQCMSGCCLPRRSPNSVKKAGSGGCLLSFFRIRTMISQYFHAGGLCSFGLYTAMTKSLSHTSKRANWTLSIRQPIFDDMTADEQSRKGISEIEGKVAEGSDERERDASEFQTSLSRVADREKLPLLLDKARKFAGQYIDSLEERPVFPGEKSLQAMHALVELLPENPSDPSLILDQLQEIGAPAVVTQTGGRYFGFVNGGILPVGLAARWMADVWDQNTAHYVMSPINSRLEEVCERWIVSLLGFPEETAAGFVSGTTIANFSGLCAGRNELLRRRGWDVARKGLYGAPKIRVVASDDAHAAVHKSISMLGLGSENVELVPVDDEGRMRADR